MDDNTRKVLTDKLIAMRKLGDEIRNSVAIPCIESYMRFVDVNCASALWHLGELDYWEYELKYDK